MRVYFTITGPGRATRTARRRRPSVATRAPTSRSRRATAASSRPSASATRAATATRTRSAARCRACRCGRCGTSPTSRAGCRRSRRSSTARWCRWRRRCTASCTRPASRASSAPAHGGDAILLGETAPLGSDKSGPINGLRPATFLREMVCVAPDGTPYAGADAARRHCQDFDRNPTLKATSLRPPPVHEEGRADDRPEEPRRDHDREHRHARPAARHARGAVGRPDRRRPAGLPDRVRLRERARPAQRDSLCAPGAVQPARRVPRLQRAARQGDDAVLAARRRAAEALAGDRPQVQGRLAGVLVHVPVRPVHDEGTRQAGRLRLHAAARRLSRRRGHRRFLGPAALPAQRLRGHRDLHVVPRQQERQRPACRSETA